MDGFFAENWSIVNSIAGRVPARDRLSLHTPERSTTVNANAQSSIRAMHHVLNMGSLKAAVSIFDA